MLMMMDTANLSHHSETDMTPAPNTGTLLSSNSDNDPESLNTESVTESSDNNADLLRSNTTIMPEDILKAQQLESDLSQNPLLSGFGGNPSQLLTAALAAATLAASGNISNLSAQDQWLAGLAPTLIQMLANQSNNTETTSPMMTDSLCDNSRLSSASSVCSDDNSQGSKSSMKRRKQSKPSKNDEKDLQALLKDMLQNCPLQSELHTQQHRLQQQQQQSQQCQQDQILQREHAKEEHDDCVQKDQEENEHCRAAVAAVSAVNKPGSEALLRSDCRTENESSVSVSLTGNEFTSSTRERQQQSDLHSPSPLSQAPSSAVPTSKCSPSLNESSTHTPVSTLSTILEPSPTSAAGPQQQQQQPSSALSSSFPANLGLDMKETNDPQQQLFLNMFANLQHKFIQQQQQQQQQSAVLFCPHCQCPCSSDDHLQQHIDMEHGSLKFFQDAVAAAAATSDGINGNADFQKLCEQFALQQKLLQEQQQSKSQPSSVSAGKKRKRHSTSPSARSAASDISSVSGADDSDHSSTKEEEIERKLSPKDVNHNLLQSSSNSTSQNQITNAFNPMISHHTPNSTPPPPSAANAVTTNTSSAAVVVAPTTTNNNTTTSSSSSSLSSATQPMNESMMLSERSCSTPTRTSNSPFGPNSNPAAAAALASMFPPNSLPPFLIQQMLNSAANGVPLPPGNTPVSTPGGLTLNGLPLPPSMGMRIFNPEAYCELCNKEFCNKYFLKTHKANKHGIYTDSPLPNGSGSDMSPMAMSRSSMGGVSPNMMNGQSGQMGGAGPKSQSLFEAGQIPSSLSQFFGQAPSPSSNSLPTSMLNRLSSIPLNLINLDSYCEICQKEFCNKYFLKKHKQKIHGYIYQGDTAIPPPNLAQQIAQSGPNGAQHYQQIQQLHALQAQMAQQGRSGQGSPGQISLTDSLQEQLSKVSSPFPSFDRSIGLNMEAFARPTSTPPLPPLLINPEAFCEYCCKEFHNKAYLDAHKVSKHDEKSEGTPENGEIQQNIVEPGQRDPTSYGNAGIDLLAIFIQQVPVQHNHSIMCEMCTQTLPNVYLVAMHKLYHHNVPFDNTKKDIEEGEVCRQTILNFSPKPIDTADSDNEPNCELKSQANDAQSDRSNDTASTLPANNPLNGTPGQDLQKLHSMIKDLGTKSDDSDDGCLKYVCHICNADFDIRLILKAHLVSEHNFPGNDEAAFFQMLTTTGDSEKGHLTQFLTPPSPDTTCEICCKEFRSKHHLKSHKQKIHGFTELDMEKGANNMLTPAMLSSIYQMQKAIPPLPPNPNQASSGQPESPIQSFTNFPPISLPKPTAPRSVITGRNYCNICNKELCNKYFMKTHMLKMHNINIDEHPISDTSTIGGVTCDICQKELCSKYFLKVHKQNTHGIYEDPAGQMMLGNSYKTKQASKVAAAAAAAAAAAVQVQHAHQQSQLMPPPSNGLGSGMPPLPGSPDLGAFNPMLIMSMMQQAAAAAASASASNDSKDESGDEFPETCQLCEQRFRHSKHLKSHLFNDHIELIAMMRSTGEIGQAISNTTGANLEHLSKLCMVCGQNCADRLAMNIHIVKEHKVSPEELALGLAGNIKMAAFLAAAATAAAAHEQQQQQESGTELSVQAPGSPRQTATPISRMSTPNSVSSPRPMPFNLDESFDPKRQSNNNNSNALQNIILKNPSILQNPMALMAAAAQSHPEIMAQFLANLQNEQSLTPPPKSEKEEKPPGRFACNMCDKVYRHSHSLHRHQLSHKKDDSTPKAASGENANKHSPAAKETTKSSSNRPKNKRYRCANCNKKFRTRELCLVHIRSEHSSNNGSSSDSKAHNLPPSPSASSEDLNQIEAQSSQTSDKASTTPFNLSSIPSPSVDDEEMMDDVDEPIDDVKDNESSLSAKDSAVGVSFESHRTAIPQVMN